VTLRTCQARLLPWESSISEASRCIRGWRRRLKSNALIFGRRPEQGFRVQVFHGKKCAPKRRLWAPPTPRRPTWWDHGQSPREGHAPSKITVALRKALLHAGPTNARHHDGQPACRRRERTVSAGAQRVRHVTGGLPKMQSPWFLPQRPPNHITQLKSPTDPVRPDSSDLACTTRTPRCSKVVASCNGLHKLL
jgi:hypothetical protein